MSFASVIKALAKSGAKTLIAGLSSGGMVGAITGKVLARTLNIDEDDEELNEKIIAASNTKEGQQLIRQAEIELSKRKTELFTDLELKKLEAKIAIQQSEDRLDEVVFSESQKSYRTELAHKDPRVYLIRPWLVKIFAYMVMFIMSTMGISMIVDFWIEGRLVLNCNTDACFEYLSNRKPYYTRVAQAWNEITILKMLGGAVVTWFGSRGVEKAISNYRGQSKTI